MLRLITVLVATAALVAALPGASTSSHKLQPSSTGAPIDLDDAQKIFENKDIHTVSQVAPFLLDVKATPKPTATTAPPKASVVAAPTPKTSVANNGTSPGIPTSGNIQVKPSENVPLGSVLGHNQSNPFLHIRDDLSPRYTCQNYPYCCPDPRYLNENSNYPYNTVGRFSSPIGSCTGTLVGPRHVLTAAHCISWDGCFKSFDPPLTFLVDYWPGHEPAVFYGETVYHYDATTCGDPQNPAQEGCDFVVVVLSEETHMGWMGVKAYSSSWNGPHYWYEQGYAADAGNTYYPYVQGPFPVVNSFNEGCGLLLEYGACATPGDSGSPVWSWWSDGPYIVGLMTEVGFQLGASASWGPAGQDMVNLVLGARSRWP